jgi:ferrous iron transport protein B
MRAADVTRIVDKILTVAVAGNPNAGKTTIFNNLTGARQHVGNYPGVTVEWKEGTLRRGELRLNIVDLPGTYSLTAFSEDELVARDYLLNQAPDVVINVVDASNLERNLYLTTELLEIGRPLVVVLNMSDAALERGLIIDHHRLSRRLGVPVVPAVGNRNQGMDDVIGAVLEAANSRVHLPGTADRCRDAGPGPGSLASPRGAARDGRVNYGPAIEAAAARLEALLPEAPHRRWQALKLLEGDGRVLEGVLAEPARRAAVAEAAAFAATITDDPDIRLARLRYEHIGRLCNEACRQVRAGRGAALSDRIDRVAMHPVWGVPIFLSLMYIVFTLTFSLGNPLMDLIDGGFGALGGWLTGLWPVGSGSHLKSLLVDGIIGGVGGVIVFLPNIVLMFMAIAVLEGTGYMARAAFVMDRFMSKVGLHGKSFIPLLIGFGCTVPAIMATRTLETRRDRLITMMVLPLMSCGARLPIYALMIPAFFAPRWQGPVLWIIYVTGILLALLGARLLRATLFRGENTPFVMELPPYRLPTGRSLLIQMWTRAWLYVQKAGTVILGASIILWCLTFYPKPHGDWVPPVENGRPSTVAYGAMTDPAQRHAAELSYSVAGRVGRVMEPLISPLGFDWRIGTALVGATAAKEVFVAQMGIVFAVGTADENADHLRAQLRDRYSPLVGLCIMMFALIATPCIATFAITRQESGSVKWALAQSIGLTALAWIITFAVYQGGMLLKWGVG